jgi:RNA-directed DNA polymerase
MQYGAGAAQEQHSAAEPFPLWSSEPYVINILLLKAKVKHRVLCSPARHYLFYLEVTFCVRGVISPLLANLFLHYAFDRWMAEKYPQVPFERYADDAIVHCRREAKAQEIRTAIAARLKECGLELHPEKTKVVYCKDDYRRRTYPNEKFDFLGYTFRPRRAKNREGKFFINFSPAVSDKAVKAIRDEIRSWDLHLRSDKQIEDLSRMFNPVIRGWLQYYGRFYRSALYPPMRQLDRSLARWAERKYKKLRGHLRRATHWVARISRRDPKLWAHWQMGVRRGSMAGAV